MFKIKKCMIFSERRIYMEIGNKIFELRKNKRLSQEMLAEKVGVTRQTISKWELNETFPDIKQAKELSNALNVSLDELVSNDIGDLVVEKVSNTEKLTGLVLKVLKWIGICFLIMLVIDIISFIIFMFIK
jgi:transcriptional regulator with XRE-family HTH domain